MKKKSKPKILCICSMGLNRSRYLASYLKNKRYKTRYEGIGFGTNKRVIVLDVTDSRMIVGEKFPKFKGMEFDEFQKKWTRPQLRKALKSFLPLRLR